MSAMEDTVTTTPQVVTDKLVLGGVPVTGVALTSTEKDANKLVISEALYTGLNIIQQQVNKLNEAGLAEDKTVITLPLVSPIFAADNGYNYLNWVIYSQQAVYVSDTADNYIQIPAVIFPSNGHYLINIKVTELASGRLEFKDKDNSLLYVITAPGDYYIDVPVIYFDTCSYRLVAVDITDGSQVVVPYLAVHRVTDRFYYYLCNKIKELASLDGGGYVDKVLFQTTLTELQTTLETQITTQSERIDQHLLDHDNPHQTTPDAIGAASVDHTHTPESIGAATVDHTHTPAAIGAAPAVHTHSQYLTEDQINTLISDKVNLELKTVHTLASLALLDGPTGVVPEEFQYRGLSAPTQVLLVNDWNPNPGYLYDYQAGLASCNQLPVEDTTLADLFARFDLHGRYAHFDTISQDLPSGSKIIIHYQFHRTRKIKSYTFHSPDTGYPVEWKVYVNFNTFVHLAQRSSYTQEDYTIQLPQAVEGNSITFELEVLSSTSLDLNIGLEFEEIEPNQIAITDAVCLYSIPRSGNNLLFSSTDGISAVLTPTNPIPDLPLYIYGEVTEQDALIYGFTYIQPECGISRLGLDVLTGLYTEDQLVADDQYDPYSHLKHPVFGTLSITPIDPVNCSTPLATIYTTTDTWYTSSDVNEVSFLHTFVDPTYIQGYVLYWDLAYRDKLPTAWSLKLTVITDDDQVQQIIADSITAYGDKLMASQSGVTYSKRFTSAYRVLAMELYLTNDNHDGLALSNWKPLLTNDFYSVTTNTMLQGNTPVNRIYLGTVVFDKQTQAYAVQTQLPLSTRCMVPVNNCQILTPGVQYQVANPFHSNDITCEPRVIGGDMSLPPAGLLVDVDAQWIYVTGFTRHQFALAISRNW